MCAGQHERPIVSASTIVHTYTHTSYIYTNINISTIINVRTFEIVLTIKDTPTNTQIVLTIKDTPTSTQIVLTIKDTPTSTQIVLTIKDTPTSTQKVLTIKDTPDSTHYKGHSR